MPRETKINVIAVQLGTALALLCFSNAAAETEIGNATSVTQIVQGKDARPIETNSPIFANERIAANNSGLAHFRFNDGTKMVVGPGSSLVLDESIYNPDGSTFNRFVLNSAAGATRFISGNSGSSVYKINTPVGTLGLRGTAFDFRHWRGRTYLMLLDGRVEICNTQNQCKTLRRKCEFVIVNTNGRISDPILPRNSLFGSRDMNRYFPFVNNQRQLQPDYRLRINTCAGGGRAGTHSGGGSSSPGSGNSGGGSAAAGNQ